MYAQIEKSKENKSRKVASSITQKKGGCKSTFQFEDNRPEVITNRKIQRLSNDKAQDSQQKTFYNTAKDNIQRMIEKGEELTGAYLRVQQYGQNWIILDRTGYMRTHRLKEISSEYADGKYIQHLNDGSIIVTDTTGQYWRHEHAQHQDQYYNSNHEISGNNAETHFWMSSKQKETVNATIQRKTFVSPAINDGRD